METDILKRVTRRVPIDIEFENLRYSVGKTQILNSICGKFQHGQLTAVLGSSGSGKTTLLNVLAGHVQAGVDGRILVNGKPRRMKSFRRISCYLMQDDALRSLFTVAESVALSARLRLGKEFSSKERALAVKEIIRIMGLEKCCDTRVEHLSGGERKRLSIALEIVRNPPVLFLDEPTTGLDYVMAKTFVQFLKSTAQDGRTIVCTIHQPSDSMFQLFDQVYFLSNGYCIYNGDPENMVPCLAKAGLTCPTTYSPFDYIIEIVQSNVELALTLKNLAGNGRANMRKQADLQEISDVDEDDAFLKEFPTSFWEQSYTLTCRTLTQMKRNKFFWAANLIPAVALGLLEGCLFWGVGNDGARLVQNVHLILTFLFYHLFQQTFTQVIVFPFEVQLFQREYANRWYSLNAYYASLSITALPSAIIPALLFTIPVYFMTDQPLEAQRFIDVMFITILTAIASQALGHALGSLLRPTLGAVVGSATIGTIILMITYGIEEAKELPVFKQILMEANFARHGFAALCVSILKGRDLLRCDEIFCYFRDTDIVLRLFGFGSRKYYVSVIYLILFLLVHKFFLYVFLRLRVARTYNAHFSRFMEFLEGKISGGQSF